MAPPWALEVAPPRVKGARGRIGRPPRSATAPAIGGDAVAPRVAGDGSPRQQGTRRRRQRGAHRLGAELLERNELAAEARERLAVLLADPLGLVARLDEPRDGVAVGRQPRGAQHQRPDAARQGEIGQLVGERSQLAQLEHVVHRHARRPEALGRRGGDGVRRRRDLLFAKVKAGELWPSNCGGTGPPQFAPWPSRRPPASPAARASSPDRTAWRFLASRRCVARDLAARAWHGRARWSRRRRRQRGPARRVRVGGAGGRAVDKQIAGKRASRTREA